MGLFIYNRYKIKNMDRKFDLKDIAIIPTIQSDISSRRECSTRKKENDMLPLMAAPMDTVVSDKNYQVFIENGIIPCLPRGLAKNHLIKTSYYFQAFGLCEIESALNAYKKNLPLSSIDQLIDDTHEKFYYYPNILIDIANRHMAKLIPIIQDIKKYWPDIKLMVGNVANPYTYKNLAMAGADYIRVSIGSGSGCTTAANVAINYPLGSLISECYKLKKDSELEAKIVADGGMQGYDDIIKALALGCFLPTTLVYTSNGYKQIQNIKIGDEVYTHNQRYKKVINTFKYANNKDVISINGIFSTDNHRYYVVNKKYH
jgi:IMP dehydrogenase/GMP reductase